MFGQFHVFKLSWKGYIFIRETSEKPALQAVFGQTSASCTYNLLISLLSVLYRGGGIVGQF